MFLFPVRYPKTIVAINHRWTVRRFDGIFYTLYWLVCIEPDGAHGGPRSLGSKICYIKTINVPKGRGTVACAVNKITFGTQFSWSLCQKNITEQRRREGEWLKEGKGKEKIKEGGKNKNNLSVFHYYLNINWFFSSFCGCRIRATSRKTKEKINTHANQIVYIIL